MSTVSANYAREESNMLSRNDFRLERLGRLGEDSAAMSSIRRNGIRSQTDKRLLFQVVRNGIIIRERLLENHHIDGVDKIVDEPTLEKDRAIFDELTKDDLDERRNIGKLFQVAKRGMTARRLLDKLVADCMREDVVNQERMRELKDIRGY